MVRPVQHSKVNIDHLHIFRAIDSLDSGGVSAHVVYNWSLKPGDHEVPTLSAHLIAHTCQLIEFYSSVTSVDYLYEIS